MTRYLYRGRHRTAARRPTLSAARWVAAVGALLIGLVAASASAPAAGVAPGYCASWDAELARLVDELGERPKDWAVAELDHIGASGAAGMTDMDARTVIIDPDLPCRYLETVVHHEWMHLQQARVYGGTQQADAHYGTRDELELIADCGALLLGARYSPAIDRSVRETGVGCTPVRMFESLRIILAR